MRVMLKTTLDCSPDAAWRAIRSPAMMQEVMSPIVGVRPLRESLPPTWDGRPHAVELLAARLVPVGVQVIDATFDETRYADVRVMRDRGDGITGAPGLLRSWDHRIAIAPAPGDPTRTLYRDRLRFDAGPLTPLVWPGLWLMWQWRMLRIRQLAPTFAHDHGAAPTEER